MASLFTFATPTTPRPKTHVSHGVLPAYIDARQPPTKRSPWRQIQAIPFVRSLSITVPASAYETVLSELVSGMSGTGSAHDAMDPSMAEFGVQSTPTELSTTAASATPTTSSGLATTTANTDTNTDNNTALRPPSMNFNQASKYFKLLQPLSTLLTTPFFTPFIKTGSVLLLSEGHPGASPLFVTLNSGTLTLSMARELYSAAGLQGQVMDRNGGARKHGHDRYRVQFDLRRAEMVGGRKGFERLLSAASGVLGDGRAWIGRDVSGAMGHEGEREGVLRGLGARSVKMVPEVQVLDGVVVPGLVRGVAGTDGDRISEFEDEYFELVEWLDLVRLGSTRVLEGDDPDPYISRYSVPEGEGQRVKDLRVVTWSGLLDAEWCTQLLIEVVRRARRVGCRDWLAVSVESYRTEALGQVDGCMVVFHAGGEGDGDGQDGGEGDGKEDGDGDVEMETGEATAAEQGQEVSTRGFRQFTCFQFVDTVTG